MKPGGNVMPWTRISAISNWKKMHKPWNSHRYRSKIVVQLGVDRKVFNVEKYWIRGGTAVDVMRNVPSVSVDIDGNVTLRNNAHRSLMEDLQPSLRQIRRCNISVELVTNPSANLMLQAEHQVLSISF
jgi:hypothetical protein